MSREGVTARSLSGVLRAKNDLFFGYSTRIFDLKWSFFMKGFRSIFWYFGIKVSSWKFTEVW